MVMKTGDDWQTLETITINDGERDYEATVQYRLAFAPVLQDEEVSHD